jgi:hypothetical protein
MLLQFFTAAKLVEGCINSIVRLVGYAQDAANMPWSTDKGFYSGCGPARISIREIAFKIYSFLKAPPRRGEILVVNESNKAQKAR